VTALRRLVARIVKGVVSGIAAVGVSALLWGLAVLAEWVALPFWLGWRMAAALR